MPRINTKDFLERYNVPFKTQDSLRASGKLPHTKTKGRISYDQEETDTLALNGVLGNNALISISNLIESQQKEKK